MWINQLWWSTALTWVTASSFLAKKPGHMECIFREATEIKLHPDNVKRVERFSLKKPLI
jgi:hypothetical protein